MSTHHMTRVGDKGRDLNNLRSASAAKSAKDKTSSGRKPPLRNRPISFSSRSLPRAEVKPHQAGEAYNIDARVVEWAIACCWGLGMRNAWMEESLEERISL